MSQVRLVGRLTLLAALAVTTWFASLRLAGELTAQDAGYRASRWESGKSKAEPAEIQSALAQLRAALGYDPGNPKLLSDLGRLEVWRVRNDPMDNASARAARQAALGVFREAARLSPASGYHWAAIAQTRYILGAADLEFGQALDQTNRWAPWQPDLQLGFIHLGLATWQILDEPRQRMVADAIQRQGTWKLTDRKPALIKLLDAYGRRELGCPWGGKAFACPGY